MSRLHAVVAFVLSLALPCMASAAAVNPSSSDLTVMPGEPAVATLSVHNDAGSPKKFEITIVQVKFGQTAEEISFTALAAGLQGAFSVTPTLFTLDAQASRTIDVTVRLPAGVEAQSPTVAILVTEKGDQGSTGSVQAAVASLLFIHVPGHLTRSYAIDSFVTVPALTFGRSTMLSALFRNDGEETIVLPNEVRVFGPFGREFGRGQLAVEPKHLPPGTTRGVTLTWPAATGFSKVLFGAYRFELWDGDQKLAQTTATFLPTGTLAGLATALLLIVLGIITFVRRRT